MKRVLLIKHLEKNNCFFAREGSKHSVYYNPKTNKSSTIPRHADIRSFLAEKICKDLGIILPPNQGK
ncbi:addiction module toxin, HicA family [Candidatus Nomurabacteria bacterium RIFCSPLOWO2_02_FULL_44_12]|uniref:Addiction module toxin, HicA family n=1 Tax=Candidatus Nomurabacteria bacterium RIFCSPLOWO2_12_FULL_44_11 TaxID=1801796 RepID=A0A1F6Y3J9_9BACT|nr:MAG: addiction module toxin, HicA family [Candidatus Nomurabacteria bacterium RIFCSPHIGHO2_12_FULL_44_22b]OGJ00954.1 MAG: addiction module toxin, HicA family [Candidatus Nomurabacteria bacterium RIFCSPLOWO2_12_FULL_44_11]OGJ08261.1 MAG: addiction module toxin, HicA family [Candidatus Nomurabacteria bacterium RIFCSPLOWO2_02_FULL_44_12]